MSDPLLDRPVLRKPKPRFGLWQPEPEPKSFAIADIVYYVGRQPQMLINWSLPDVGQVFEGPKTAAELGIVHPSVTDDDIFYNVMWNNRLGTPATWTLAKSLT